MPASLEKRKLLPFPGKILEDLFRRFHFVKVTDQKVYEIKI